MSEEQTQPQTSEPGAPEHGSTPGRRYKLALLIGTLLLLVAIPLAWHRWSRPQVSPESQRMHDLLREIAEKTQDQNPWLGDGTTREMRRQLSELPDDTDELTRLILTAQLGRFEVQLGNEQEGIAHLEGAYQKVLQLEESLSPADVVETAFRLGLAYMRLGESENCCLLNTPDSCLLPIQGGGIHKNPSGSKQAIERFTEVLERTDGSHLRARWLLNIAHMTLGQYPDGVPPEYLIAPEVFASDESFPRFYNVAAEMELDTFSNAGGVVADDFDDDGDLDILTSTYDSSEQMHLFLNNNDGTFSDRTEEARLGEMLGGLNMVQADYDNDGDIDVYVMRGAWLGDYGRHPNSLLRNEGDATFVDVTFETGLGDVHFPSQTAAWADYDNDGDLDLYVGNEHMPNYSFIANCQLFRNNGDGTFTDVAQLAGVENFAFTKGVVWGDYDGDRFPDLYVSNLGGLNRLYHNNGDGTFTNVAASVGVDSPRNSFPTWFWDFDNDGVLDIYVPSYLGLPPALEVLAASYLGMPHDVETPKLYRGDGSGGFEEVSRECQLSRLAFPMGANFGDLDNDGYLDFYLGTGYPDFEALMPNVMYRNVGGKHFSDVTVAGGFGHLQKGHAIAFADFDQDGDQDVFEQMGGGYAGDTFADALYENPGFDNRWLTIQLVGERSNRSAIGARIRIDLEESGEQRTVYKHVNSGGSFGANPLRQTIGLGKATKVSRLEIYWPTTDHTQIFHDVEMDRFLRIAEDDDKFTVVSSEPIDFGPDRSN